MEGIGAEAALLAGHLRLSNLCWIYDNNGITIEGSTGLAFSEECRHGSPATAGRCSTSPIPTTLDALDAAFQVFRDKTSRPTLLVVDSVIGYGAPNKQGRMPLTASRSGGRGPGRKRFYGWPEDGQFLVREDAGARPAERSPKGL